MSWDDYLGMVLDKSAHVEWPTDLQSVMAGLVSEPQERRGELGAAPDRGDV